MSHMRSGSWIGAALVLGLGIGFFWLATMLAADTGVLKKVNP